MRNVPEGTPTAGAAGSSPVVPAIPSNRVLRISLQPMRVQTGALLHPLLLRRQKPFLPDVSGKSIRLADYTTSTEWQSCESVQTQKPDDQRLICRLTGEVGASTRLTGKALISAIAVYARSNSNRKPIHKFFPECVEKRKQKHKREVPTGIPVN